MHARALLLTIVVLCWSQLSVLSDAGQSRLFELLPSPSHVTQASSDVTFHCVRRINANADTSAPLLANVGLLFSRRGPSLSADPLSDVQFVQQTWRNDSTVAVTLSDVSTNRHCGWYRCGCTSADDAGRPRALSSQATRLIVGSPPNASGMSFYWLDRRHFESAVHPSLDKIAEATRVPRGLGGNVNLSLTYARPSSTSLTICGSSCRCNNTGYCVWDPQSQGDDSSMRVELRLCNALNWCRTHSYEFDMRDMERPDPVRELALQFEPHQLNISWEPPTTELPGDQEYTYEVSLSDGRRLATNATRVSLPVRPGTDYSATVRCRPRHFSGYWSDNVSNAGRSGDWLPCNPRPAGAFLLPPDTLVFPASDRSCRNGRIIYYRIVDLISNRSQIVHSNASSDLPYFVLARLNLTVGFRDDGSCRLLLGILAATSAGENSSLAAEIPIGPVDGACDGDGPWDRGVTCLGTAAGASLMQCGQLSNLAQLPVASSSTNSTWLIRRGVACPVAVSVDEGSPRTLATGMAPFVLASVLLIIARCLQRCRCSQSAPVPPADRRTYAPEPDCRHLRANELRLSAVNNRDATSAQMPPAQLGETSPDRASGTVESAATFSTSNPWSSSPELSASATATGLFIPVSGYCDRHFRY